MKYADILKTNQKFKPKKSQIKLNIGLISNSNIHQLQEVLKFKLYEEKINVKVDSGGYNTIIEDAVKFSNHNVLIFFWDTFNIIEEFNSKVLNLASKDLKKINEKIKNDIDKLIKKTKNSTVIFNKFSLSPFSNNFILDNLLDNFCEDLNNYLNAKKPKNWIIIDIEKIFFKLGAEKSLNLQQFYFSKCLYTVEFFEKYLDFIKPIFINLAGKSKKVIILDCDNTLWGGILGEQEQKNLNFLPESFEGRIFNEVQEILKYFSKNGVLLAINSKNNFKDVSNFFKKSSMPLKLDDFVIVKANWQNKVKNIKEISKELNLSTDSFIFIDDSQFEIDFVKKNLPNIKTIKVPENLSLYPKKIKEISNLIFYLNKTKEDKKKTKMYKVELKRKKIKSRSVSLRSYLKSLNLSMKINWGGAVDSERASQMCQKTNQFNLTTKRYSKSDIEKFKSRKDVIVLEFSLKDKFGDYGITGLSIIKIKKKHEAYIDLFLMSCRVIGRNAENLFLENIIKKLTKKTFLKLKLNMNTLKRIIL
jgi:FkbH-like protein